MVTWIFTVVLLSFLLVRSSHSFALQNDHSHSENPNAIVPPDFCSPFGSYPNLLDIQEGERQFYHPVVVFPTIIDEEGNEIPNVKILDFTKPTEEQQLATEEERQMYESEGRKLQRHEKRLKMDYAVGRYDEKRPSLYQSEMFEDSTNDIDGFKGIRDIHIGIDLDGPVGTPVYAFSDGSIHKVGYNAELGDYGNVIVIRHELYNKRSVYALYGHLSHSSIKDRQEGDIVRKGDLLGHFGDIHENGGWYIPHVHFQLSMHPPATHDMPGVIAEEDRPRALLEYPDPRYILGPLY